jgi:hypothetical protein
VRSHTSLHGIGTTFVDPVNVFLGCGLQTGAVNVAMLIVGRVIAGEPNSRSVAQMNPMTECVRLTGSGVSIGVLSMIVYVCYMLPNVDLVTRLIVTQFHSPPVLSTK